jgi:purine-cytosine permease-like protein
MKQDVENAKSTSDAPPVWVGNLLVGVLTVYVVVLGIGVVGVVFDIRAILDLFAFLTP